MSAVELAPAALEYARRNAERLGAAIDFHLGDGLAPLAGAFDLVVSNPPYVDPAERERLSPEVREHEPAEALFAPAGDPDHWVRRLVSEGRARIASGGWLLVELGAGQATRLEAWIPRAPAWRLHRDLERIERVLEVGPPTGAHADPATKASRCALRLGYLFGTARFA